jgi:hypothetical protein
MPEIVKDEVDCESSFATLGANRVVSVVQSSDVLSWLPMRGKYPMRIPKHPARQDSLALGCKV